MKRILNPKEYLSLLNGLIGDKLALSLDEWAIKMSFRMGGEDVPVSKLAPHLKGKKLFICVHGLMADDRIWKDFTDLGRGVGVLTLRYNTGLHISENGQSLAQLLQELQDRFNPKSIYLCGHSMGGLVVRSACYYAAKKKLSWLAKVPTIFLIAVPNAGAALEKLGHTTTFVLKRIARWHLGKVGSLIDQRSNGIKDLRLGCMVEEDWKSPTQERTSVPPVPGIDYHILIGNLSAHEKSLLAKYFGDGLVTHSSAVGVTFLNTSTVKIFPRTGHNAILKNKEVHKYIRLILKLR